MTPRLAEPLHVCSTQTLAHIVNTARASSIITEAWSRFDSRFFVCKYFVVRLSTTKTTKILPLEKYPLYGISVCVLLHDIGSGFRGVAQCAVHLWSY